MVVRPTHASNMYRLCRLYVWHEDALCDQQLYDLQYLEW
jgi:hypothetical protein